MTEKKSAKLKTQVTFRPTPKVMELLEEAQKATGSDRSDLILACIDRALARVVEEEVERQLMDVQARVAALKKSKQK